MIIKKVLFFLILIPFIPLRAHFQMIIPDRNLVENIDSPFVEVQLIFCHPFEGDIMNMERPEKFGVVIKGQETQDLLDKLKKKSIDKKTSWKIKYTLKKPGDYVFFVEPKPYWEPAEGKFIVHYSKVVVNGFGLEKGWDKKVGLKAEIIPLTRPYGIYTGNLFRGLVLIDGEPAPFVDVEVEYYNKNHRYKVLATSFITQVVKTDANGVFSYSMPVSGWWGFAALSETERKLLNKEDKKYYPVEIGAIFWVNVQDMELR